MHAICITLTVWCVIFVYSGYFHRIKIAVKKRPIGRLVMVYKKVTWSMSHDDIINEAKGIVPNKTQIAVYYSLPESVSKDFVCYRLLLICQYQSFKLDSDDDFFLFVHFLNIHHCHS